MASQIAKKEGGERMPKNSKSKPSNIDKTLSNETNKNHKLTEKQRLFCASYAKTFNAKQSAVNAGYSPETAYQMGYENLTKPYIRDEIERLKAARSLATLSNVQDVIGLHTRIAFADITDFLEIGSEEYQVLNRGEPVFDENGEPLKRQRNFVKLKPNVEIDGQIVTEVKQGKDGVTLKLADKQRSLDFLAKYYDVFGERENADGGDIVINIQPVSKAEYGVDDDASTSQ